MSSSYVRVRDCDRECVNQIKQIDDLQTYR